MQSYRDTIRRLIGTEAAIVIIIFLIQAFTLYLDLYGIIHWFDNLMHFMGGVFLAYLLSVLALRYLPRLAGRMVLFFAIIVLGVFVIGAVWEIYEFVVDAIFGVFRGDYLDIATDLLFDTLGGTIALYIIWETEIKKLQHETHE